MASTKTRNLAARRSQGIWKDAACAHAKPDTPGRGQELGEIFGMPIYCLLKGLQGHENDLSWLDGLLLAECWLHVSWRDHSTKKSTHLDPGVARSWL